MSEKSWLECLKEARGLDPNKKHVDYDTFQWVKCTRKNGTEFLKLIYYSTYADGYVEAGRFNMSKHDIPQNEWCIDEILKEIE